MSLSNQMGLKLLKEAAEKFEKLSPDWSSVYCRKKDNLDLATSGQLDIILKILEPIWSSPENKRPPGLDTALFLSFIRKMRTIGPKDTWKNHVTMMDDLLRQMFTKLKE